LGCLDEVGVVEGGPANSDAVEDAAPEDEDVDLECPDRSG
jgi:hypothetical protein